MHTFEIAGLLHKMHVPRAVVAEITATPKPREQALSDEQRMQLRGIFDGMRELCDESGLLVSRNALVRMVKTCDENEVTFDLLRSMLVSLSNLLQDECSTHVFFKIDADKKKHFDDPRKNGWAEIIQRFGKAAWDIEESGKCLALERAPAAVFHALQAVEVALIEVGEFLCVNDHKPGWDATVNELKRIVKSKYDDRTAKERQYYKFIEQLLGTVEVLKSAWRDKVSHADGKLVLMTTDFSEHIAEEIIYAARSFMRRVATDLPQDKLK